MANFGYSRAKTVNENLKIKAALISRFDLVFILLDKPDEQLDKKVSEHIMSVSQLGPLLFTLDATPNTDQQNLQVFSQN